MRAFLVVVIGVLTAGLVASPAVAGTDRVPATELVDVVAAARARDFVATGRISTVRSSKSTLRHDDAFGFDKVLLPVAPVGSRLVSSSGVWVWVSGPQVFPVAGVAAAGSKGLVTGSTSSAVGYQQALGLSAPLLVFDAVSRTGGYVKRVRSGARVRYVYRARQGASVYVLKAYMRKGQLRALRLSTGMRGRVSTYTSRLRYRSQSLFVPVVASDDVLAARLWCAQLSAKARRSNRAVLASVSGSLPACAGVKVRRTRAVFVSPVTGRKVSLT